MALQGTFILNNADYSPLTLYGVGTFLAFSGNGVYKNRGGCAIIPNEGPIPPGKYWIVDRPDGGGFGSWAQAVVKDTFNKVVRGAEFTRFEWFALYRDDKSIDDSTWYNHVLRGHFRLHPGTLSEGCITLPHNSDYAVLRNALLRTGQIRVPCMKSLMTYGSIEVIANGNTCP